MKSNAIKKRFLITSLFILLVVISGSYSIPKFDVFAQTSSSSDFGNGPIPEDNSTYVNNAPIPEDNSTYVNNAPNPQDNSTDLNNGFFPGDNSTDLNNGPSTLPEGNQTTTQGAVPEFPFAGLALIIATFSIVMISKSKSDTRWILEI
jgi:hypothetical protein